MITKIIPYTVSVLQLLASGIYLLKGDFRLSIIWAGIGVANLALAGVK